jgi:hypothetical protein
MARLDSRILLGFLEEVDKELGKSITLVAVGGTALTLLGAKPSTRDVDFALPSDDYDEFERTLSIVPHGFEVHCFDNGMIFSQSLPDDYLERTIPVRTKMKNINLRTLSPLDIVVTKIGRLDLRDKQDINTCIKKFHLTKAQVGKRAKQVDYVGRQENYDINLRHVLENLFKK